MCGIGVRELCFQRSLLPNMAIDRAIASRVFHTPMIIARAEEALYVDRRYTLKCQHDGMGANEAFETIVISSIFKRALEKIEQGDIEFIGFIESFPRSPECHLAAGSLRGLH